MKTIMDELVRRSKKSPVCLGLDTRLEFLPEHLRQASLSDGEKIFAFNKAVIDETKDDVACYKVQIACYEALGLDGLKAYSDTVKYARDNGALVIGDIKRGDIASSAKQYAAGHLSGDFEVDFVTVNPYMGSDAITPYLPYIGKDKGLFILTLTSNPSAAELEELESEGGRVYEHVGELIDRLGENYIGETDFSAIGAVVGLTRPESFEKIKLAHPHQFFLVPGYGAQGGSAQDVQQILTTPCAVINNSRALLTAHSGGLDFAKEIGSATRKMKEELIGNRHQ